VVKGWWPDDYPRRRPPVHGMKDVGAFIQALAGSMYLWRDLAIAGFAGLLIFAIWLYASAVE